MICDQSLKQPLTKLPLLRCRGCISFSAIEPLGISLSAIEPLTWLNWVVVAEMLFVFQPLLELEPTDSYVCSNELKPPTNFSELKPPSITNQLSQDVYFFVPYRVFGSQPFVTVSLTPE